MKKTTLSIIALAALTISSYGAETTSSPAQTEAKASQGIKVTRENYQYAEAIRNATNYVKLDGDNKWGHFRDPSPVGPTAPTIRMNLDTLYSVAVVDNSNGKFEITIPENEALHTVLVLDEQAYSLYYFQTPGVHEIVSKSPYIIMLARQGLKDFNNPEDVANARKMQDGLKISGNGPNSFNPTKYDQASLHVLTEELGKEFLASDGELVYGQFKDDVDEHKRLLSNAAGWGGMHDQINTYTSSVSMSGDVCRQITYEDPKVKDFFSFTLYDDAGYLMDGKTSINSYNMKKNADGTYTTSFNCGKDAINNITSTGREFNYIVRTYGASEVVKSGKWNPVAPTVVK